MLRTVNQKKLIRHLSRFMHDRYLPEVKPNTTTKPKKIGVNSPMKESIPKLDYSSKSSKFYSRNENGDLIHLIFKSERKQ